MFQLLPFGPDRADVQASVLARTVAAAGGMKRKDGRPIELADFGLLPSAIESGAVRGGMIRDWKVLKALLTGKGPLPTTAGGA